MLDLDLDLEADLGVDTVKQAEMFAAIREIYSIPRDENRKLRDYPTLAHVIRLYFENGRTWQAHHSAATTTQPSPASPAPVAASSSTPVVPSPAPIVASLDDDEAVEQKVMDIVAEKTGYPKDMLDLDLDLEADLGIDRSTSRNVCVRASRL